MADDEPALLTISDMAKLLAMHPQTLRLYERQGFITPARTKGNTRLYSAQDALNP
jgi:MerR family transcriptional regulator/heat shock protein HspR